MSLFDNNTTILHLPVGLTDEEVLAKYQEFRIRTRFTQEEVREASHVFERHLRPEVNRMAVERGNMCERTAGLLYKTLMEEYYPTYETVTHENRAYIASEMKAAHNGGFTETTRAIWAEHGAYKHFHQKEQVEKIKDTFVRTVTIKMQQLWEKEYLALYDKQRF
jgi:superfamily II DNA or RNA helicase